MALIGFACVTFFCGIVILTYFANRVNDTQTHDTTKQAVAGVIEMLYK